MNNRQFKYFEISEEEIQKAREAFQKNKWVAIPNICYPEVAEKMATYLLSPLMPKEQWFHSSQYAGAVGTQYVQEVPKNLPKIVANRASAQKRGSGVLNYSFTRTMMNAEDAKNNNPTFYQFYEFIGGDRLLSLLSKITDINVESIETLFASKYVTGDFLDVHTDAAQTKRCLAFVFNLSKDWSYDYGGCLHIRNTAIVPSFNSFLIFDVRNGGVPHHVSEVTDKTNETRLAISGWLNQKVEE